MGSIVKFEELKGKIFREIIVCTPPSSIDNSITFYTITNDKYILFHEQDCCESVTIEDICGDTNDLLGMPILLAEEVSNTDDPPRSEYDVCYTWTFYKLSTNRGSVTIRWYGESNGCYSEKADLVKY